MERRRGREGIPSMWDSSETEASKLYLLTQEVILFGWNNEVKSDSNKN